MRSTCYLHGSLSPTSIFSLCVLILRSGAALIDQVILTSALEGESFHIHRIAILNRLTQVSNNEAELKPTR